MLVMIYRTYEASTPVVLSVPPGVPDEQFVAFARSLAETVRRLQSSGCDRTSVTVSLLAEDGENYVTKLDVEI